MRTALLGTAFAVLAGAALATPALADGARVEIQSGAAWNDGRDAKGTIGAALGYDYSLTPQTFIGGEINVDKTLAAHRDTTVGFTGRVGVKLDPRDKLYALAGYSVSSGPEGAIVGGGWERQLQGPIYGKVEYRHLFTDNSNDNTGFPDSHYQQSNQVLVGAGFHF